MSEFRLYNTLTRAVEPFVPADGTTVRMYTCGPTVYNPAHLGNFRTFLFEDLLRRVIRLRGWTPLQVMNLTDVDDKIIKRAAEQGKTITQLTDPVVETFFRDRDWLRIEPAEQYPRATAYIPQMIALVQTLLDRGVAYKADDDSIYFAIGRFPAYGRLSRLDTRQIRAGARVAADDYNKEDVRDFALWKAAKDEDERAAAAWDSPWGRGRPGWHLECSAMAMDLLGETLDIHCGGVDLIFPHHEDEIAQSEGATGRPFSRVWCHGEFLLTDGAKMAKRVGNVTNVSGLQEARIPAAAVRHFVFSTHYRKQLNLTEDALDASVAAVQRVGEFADRLAKATGGTPALAAAAETALAEATAALYDDLNAPAAMGALFVFIRRANTELDRNGKDAAALERARAIFRMIDGALDIVPTVVSSANAAVAQSAATIASGSGDIDPLWIEERLAARRAARSARDFATADAIRAELIARGIEIKDTAGGSEWKRLG